MMPVLSRQAAPILALTVAVTLIAHFAGPGGPLSVALTAVIALSALFLPPEVLLAAALVTGSGLGITALQAPLVGPLLLSDLLLLACLGCLLQRRPGEAKHDRFLAVSLALFVGWSLLATLHVGTSVTPLLRIALYGAVFLLLARHRGNRKPVYAIVTCYALVNVVGGVIQDQTRLVGLDIGDPAQTGALLLAALCPLLTSELRTPLPWLVGAVLLCGIFLTQTRSVWFATVVVLVVWAQKRLTLPRLLVWFTALALLGLQTVSWVTGVFGLNSTSADYRWQTIDAGLRRGFESPLFGSGWGYASSGLDHSVPSYLNQAVDSVLPYNLFVCVFASVGVPGVLMLALFVCRLLHRLVARRGAPLLFTVAVLAMSLTEMTLYAGSMLTLLFFTYAGMGLAPATDAPMPSDPPTTGGGGPSRASAEGPATHTGIVAAGSPTGAVGGTAWGSDLTRTGSTRNQHAGLNASRHSPCPGAVR
ncbi:O-antigen ligase family protein [Streptomyces sp. NPDC018833]|uniref:O-antigen ligase family protein n=1 Tax=Streptomyces sp. NPDC018833 TaxID=3365053 RepID=UPI0037AC52BA